MPNFADWVHNTLKAARQNEPQKALEYLTIAFKQISELPPTKAVPYLRGVKVIFEQRLIPVPQQLIDFLDTWEKVELDSMGLVFIKERHRNDLIVLIEMAKRVINDLEKELSETKNPAILAKLNKELTDRRKGLTILELSLAETEQAIMHLRQLQQ